MPGPGTYWWGTHCSFLMGRRGYRLPAGKDQYVPAPRVMLLITRGPLLRGCNSKFSTPPPVTGPDLRRGVTLSNDQGLWFNEAPHIAPPRWIEATGSGYPPGTDPTVFRPATRRTTRPVHAWKGDSQEWRIWDCKTDPRSRRAKLSHPVCRLRSTPACSAGRIPCPIDVCRSPQSNRPRLIYGAAQKRPRSLRLFGGPARPQASPTAFAEVGCGG